MLQRRRLLISAIFLLMIAACLFAACDGSYINKDKLPLKPWQEYIADVSRAIDLQYINISAQQPIAMEMSLNALDNQAQERYECSLTLNLDKSSRDAQQGAFKIIKKTDSQRKVMLDVFNDGDKLYWCKWQSDAGSYEKTVFENAPLIYSLQEVFGALGANVDYSTPGILFESLANVFFTDGGVMNAEGDEYVFDFDLKKGLSSAFTINMFENLPQVLQKAFFSIAKVDSYDDMLAKTPSLKGSVHIKLKDKLIERVYCDNLEYIDASGHARVLSIDMPLIRVTNGRVDLSSSAPEGDYGDGRFTDMTVTGKVKFENSHLEKVEMQYDYQLNAKLDVLQLLADGGDINSLADDNFFHFKMTHKCDDGCTAFCADKLDKAKGAVLDIAFSPKDFGNHNIYISVGARFLLSHGLIAQLTSQLSTLQPFIERMLPEYVLAVVSADNFSSNSNMSAHGDKYDVKSILEGILMALKYEEGSLSFSIDEVMDIFGFEDSVGDIINGVFESETYSIDRAELLLEDVSWHVRQYDVKRSAIHLYGNDVSGTKQYTSSLIKAPVLNYVVDGKAVANGNTTVQVVDIFNGIYKDEILANEDMPICEAEFDDLIGSYVNATVENIYGEQSKQNMTVIGYSLTDGVKTGWQEVELYCLPTGASYVERLLWENIGKQEWRKWLSHTVKTHIYVDTLEDVQFDVPEKTEYMQGAKFLSSSRELLDIGAKLTYGGGKTKDRYVVASNAEDIFMYDTLGARYIKSADDVILNYYLFGRYCGVKIDVTPAKSKDLIAKVDEVSLEFSDKSYSTELCAAYFRWELADGTKSEVRLPLDNLKINGYALNEVNDYFYLDPISERLGVIFKKPGRYTLSYTCDGLSIDVPLVLTPKAQEEDKSEYGIDFVDSLKDNYFIGYAYNFRTEIFNLYHGEVGAIKELKFEIRKGSVNSSGDLTYGKLEESQEYFEIQSVTLDGKDVTLPYQLELPPTVYGSIPMGLKVKFTQIGYYRLIFMLGEKSCSCDIYVSSLPA